VSCAARASGGTTAAASLGPLARLVRSSCVIAASVSSSQLTYVWCVLGASKHARVGVLACAHCSHGP
jgi:hypothetical protein